MELFVICLAILVMMYVCFKVGQVDIKMQAEKFQRDLFKSYDGDSNTERSFRNGVRYIVGLLINEPQEYEDAVSPDPDEINAAEISTIYDLLISFGYNRSTDDMIELCKELIVRVTGDDWRYDKHKITDEGDIIYGYIIMLFGNYGTSPRSGWFEDEKENLVPLIVDQIKQRLQELVTAKEIEED